MVVTPGRTVMRRLTPASIEDNLMIAPRRQCLSDAEGSPARLDGHCGRRPSRADCHRGKVGGSILVLLLLEQDVSGGRRQRPRRSTTDSAHDCRRASSLIHGGRAQTNSRRPVCRPLTTRGRGALSPVSLLTARRLLPPADLQAGGSCKADCLYVHTHLDMTGRDQPGKTPTIILVVYCS